MNFVTTLSKGAKNVGTLISKESPTILTALSVIGTVSTVAAAIKATPTAVYILGAEEERRQYEFAERDDFSEDDLKISTADIIKLTWKYYVPTMVLGATTIACTIGANTINTRRNAALASLYALAEKTMKEYQEKVVETLGQKKEERIRDEIAQDRLNNNPIEGRQVLVTGKGQSLFYDGLSGRYFFSDMETVRRSQNDFNQELLTDMYKPVNDLYYMLGLEGTDMGRDAGWNVDDGLLEIHFSAKIATNGEPCIVLDYRVAPKKL